MATRTSRRAAAAPQPTATVRREPALVSIAALAAVRSAGYEAEMDAVVTLPIEATGSRLARLLNR